MTWGRDTDEHESRDQLDGLPRGRRHAARHRRGLRRRRVRGADRRAAARARPARRRGDLHQGRHLPPHRRARRRHLAPGACSTRSTARLARLGTDHVDLWHGAHLERRRAARGDPRRARRSRSPAAGRATSGISNYTGWQTARAATWQAAGAGRARSSPRRSSTRCSAAGSSARCCRPAAALGLGVLAWSPLGRGVLTGKYRTGTPADSRAASPHFAAFVERFLDAGLARSRRRGGDRGRRARTARRPRSRWPGCATSPASTAPIVGARTAAQLRGHAEQ